MASKGTRYKEEPSIRILKDVESGMTVAEAVESPHARQIGFRSLIEAIDTTAGCKLIFHIFGALAEFERSVIRERTNARLTSAWARGKMSGRLSA